MLAIISTGLPPKPANLLIKYYSVNKSADSNVNITFMWDMEFNAHHAIESYHITPFSDTVTCPMSCPFDRPRVCINTGKLPKEGVSFNIYAILIVKLTLDLMIAPLFFLKVCGT